MPKPIDLPLSLSRRRAITRLGLLGTAPLISCASDVVTAAASADASLSGLSLSAGTMSPTFATATTVYSASVPNATTSLTVSPAAADTGATITVNGTSVARGATTSVALAVGANAVLILVTAANGTTTQIYALTVTRAAPVLGSDASLVSLALSAGTLAPTFASATTSYTVSVTNGVASLTVTPTAAGSGATINVNGTAVASGSASAALALVVGTTTIPILVTAADGTMRIYSITVTRAAAPNVSCVLIPSETDGPYPDYAIFTNSILRRKDIREDRTGLPLTLILDLVNVSSSCGPVSNAAVYVWHCDKDGHYSGYSGAMNGGDFSSATWLRGVQTTDANGRVTFTTIYPGWYAGRITHIHFQVYLNDNLSSRVTATSQIAFPQSVTQAVYASSLYVSHGQNTSVTSFAADNVFSDGTQFQLATLTGDVTNGYAATLTVGIAA